jgi:hypothetical protein
MPRKDHEIAMDPATLNKEQLVDIVQRIQHTMYTTEDDDCKPVWDPDFEWDSEIIELVAGVLDEYKLIPKKIGPVQR